ncbi:MAG: EI24 domain-containing protein [Saprospiraceae bacterium]|nr:EI24 domain-containing protein [Saprospiraceae bacterium]
MAYQSNNMPTTEGVAQKPEFFRDFFDGIASYFKAFQLIARHKLWYYMVVPGFASVILGLSIFYAAYILSDDVTSLLTAIYPSTWWGAGVVANIAAVFSWILLGITGILGYRIVLMALVSPFMSPLAARIQSEVTGRPVYDPPFFSTTNIRLILRGATLSLRNVLKELWYVLWLLLLGLIPVIGWFSAIAIFFVQSFYAGFGNLDYSLEKYYGLKESKKFAARYRGLAVGNGAAFLTLLAVPIIGFFVAPALSVAAATVESTKRIDTPLKNVQQLEEFI